MSLLSGSSGGTSASGNDAASPPVTATEEVAPPPALLAALRLLEAHDPSAAGSFDRAVAAEVSPAWRALALLGRGFCEAMSGSRAAARASIRSALREWAGADPGGCAVALAALGRALAAGPDASLSTAFLASAQRLSEGSPPVVLGAVLLELGTAAAESGEAHTAATRWEGALDGGDPRTQAAAAANLGRLAAARGDAAIADRMFERALEVADGPHVPVVADGLVSLASQAAADGRWEEVAAWLRQALALRQAEQDARGAAAILHDLGIAHWRRGQLHGATRCLEDCRASAENLGDDELRGAALCALAGVAIETGRLVVALAYAQEAALAARSTGQRRAVASVFRQVGDEARRQGSASLSGEAFRAAARILSEGG